MNRKLPVDAFDFYYALGPSRSYKAVAEKFGVNKRSVTSLALREQWQSRIVELERRAREKSDTRVIETIEEMQTRHLKTLSAVYAKALETLKRLPIDTGMQAVKAIEMVIRQERVIRGEPTERNAVDVEQLIKREYALLMTGDADDGEPRALSCHQSRDVNARWKLDSIDRYQLASQCAQDAGHDHGARVATRELRCRSAVREP